MQLLFYLLTHLYDLFFKNQNLGFSKGFSVYYGSDMVFVHLIARLESFLLDNVIMI